MIEAETERGELYAESVALREAAGSSLQHRRTPGIVADLALGLRYMLRFALDIGAIDEARVRELWTWGWRALGEAAEVRAANAAVERRIAEHRGEGAIVNG